MFFPLARSSWTAAGPEKKHRPTQGRPYFYTARRKAAFPFTSLGTNTRRRFGRSPSTGSLYCAVCRTHALCTPGQGLETSGAVRPTLLAVPCRRDLAGVIRFRPTLIPHSWATWCVRPRRLRHRRHPLVRRGKSRPTSSPLCRTRTTTLVRHSRRRVASLSGELTESRHPGECGAVLARATAVPTLVSRP